jgi:membrane fusion protein, heavy metal efflux system
MKHPLLLIFLAAGVNLPTPALAATVSGDSAGGPVRITRTMAQNLALEIVEVELRPIEKTVPALGVVEPAAGKVAAVTSRVAGRVTQLAAYDGQRVKGGEVLLEVESRVVADPPPRLTFSSPLDGVVLETHVILGAAVEPADVLVTVVDLSEVAVVARVPEGRLAAIRPGQAVRIRPMAHPDLVIPGVVKLRAASLDQSSGTLRVFVQAANPGEKLLPGMRAQLAFVTAALDDAVVVPREAVVGEAGDWFVFREVEPLVYERTPVVTGLRDDRYIEIIEGVLPGDRVVTRGSYQLQFVGDDGAAKLEDDHGHSHGPGGHQH